MLICAAILPQVSGMEGWLADDDSDGSNVSDGSDVAESSVVTGMVADMLSVCKVPLPCPEPVCTI